VKKMMSDKVNEQLSALVDDECTTSELALIYRRLSKDAEMKARWQRYHLISDALRNSLPYAIETEFAEHIREKVAAESSSLPSVSFARRQIRPAIGWAAAASVAAGLALSYSKVWQSDSAIPQIQDHVAISAAGLAPATEEPVQTLSSDLTDAERAMLINNYLANHNEFSFGNSIHGIVPYMQTVTYISDSQ
jgi:sigma-E factor negative regulatory protein RseA